MGVAGTRGGVLFLSDCVGEYVPLGVVVVLFLEFVLVAALSAVGVRLLESVEDPQLMGYAGTLVTARRRIQAKDFAAYSREEVRAAIDPAKVTNTKHSHYIWSPAELDVNCRSIYELKFHHFRQFWY